MELKPRFWEIFFEVYEALPRQGPGNRASTSKAFGYCTSLPDKPTILDLGCGAGAQTLDLADLTCGEILAMDNHEPFIGRLNKKLDDLGLSPGVKATVGDMARPELPPQSIDLIWSEGALYNIGIENALRICHGLLRPGGYLAFTDAVWRRENPPAEIKASFGQDYPDMGSADDIRALIISSGFELCGQFTLPDQAWMTGFYTPMEQRIEQLRKKYTNDPEAVAILNELANEPVMHRRYTDYYAYEFFVVQRPLDQISFIN